MDEDDGCVRLDIFCSLDDCRRCYDEFEEEEYEYMLDNGKRVSFPFVHFDQFDSRHLRDWIYCNYVGELKQHLLTTVYRLDVTGEVYYGSVRQIMNVFWFNQI